MLSFRTEIENPLVQKDIIELDKKIQLYQNGKIDEDGFRSLRLARGIYGQRQEGVQMIRIKLPFGRLNSEQLHRIADVSDEYSKGRLHITTRQDIQIHYVSLDRTPELWAELEKSDITLREACGNAVRNVTASEMAGIDPEEPFDVSPYADAVFKFFLRNPICQELGRKFKISFSSSDKDSALSFIHDLGFIAKVRYENNKEIRGFKVMIAGGLGAQPRQADILYDFLETDKIIPFIESTLRVFDRHGERNRRAKARLKHLVLKIGLEKFIGLVEEEKVAVSNTSVNIDTHEFDIEKKDAKLTAPEVQLESEIEFENWKKSNVIAQKQEGYFAIGIKVRLGDFYTDKARKLADLIRDYAQDELRLTISQDILIRGVQDSFLPFFYVKLKELGFTDLGYGSIMDVTSCPGTDTCNLGIASSTGLALELEKTLSEEFPMYVDRKDISIKISGCMNACGQHSIAQIGFYGMSMKKGNLVIPAFQVLLGGGNQGDGQGRFADKIIKIPSKKAPDALRRLIYDFEDHKSEGQSFNAYYLEQGKSYFYSLLKPVSEINEDDKDLFIDWGHDEAYIKAIGVGECAGVVIDLVSTLLFETEEKLENAFLGIDQERWADSIYHSYAAIVNTAKAVLIGENIKTNTQSGIIKDFDQYFVESGLIQMDGTLSDLAYQIKSNKPEPSFAQSYLKEAKRFYELIDKLRTNALNDES
ncbi:nitrite reductase [Lutimonas zeaxanthinifaciens]|uniref:nitrite reductase n=1 Tax=Lutimonas zeaxanthinifaciens TaxID=3060215 RepID=UPI00265D1936|nr:nitrite reductase [Lutimonas sp. YSD2104]WKK65239.1 nitrite reductase [Lutimonas sp. YSD2104]